METLISRNAKEISEISQVYLRSFNSRMKRITASSYKLIEFLTDKSSSADTVVNKATVEFGFEAVVLIENFVFNEAYEKIRVAGSHFGTYGHTIDLVILIVSEWKTV